MNHVVTEVSDMGIYSGGCLTHIFTRGAEYIAEVSIMNDVVT